MPFLVDNPQGVSVPTGPGGLGQQFETAPDGGTYFAILGPSINLVRSIQNIIAAERIYLTYPGGKGRDQAAALAIIRAELETAVHASGVATAQFAEERARSILEKRIVRPTTPKPDHLRDAIIARAIRGAANWGAVGIGDIESLDQFPYWRAQEFGSTHLVGKQIRGFFFDGGQMFAPDPTQRRQHPIFLPMSGPKMTVENPIKGKAFLTEATIEALNFRYRLWRNIEKSSVAQVRSVRVATLGDLAGTPFGRTVGGFARIARYRR